MADASIVYGSKVEFRCARTRKRAMPMRPMRDAVGCGNVWGRGCVVCGVWVTPCADGDASMPYLLWIRASWFSARFRLSWRPCVDYLLTKSLCVPLWLWLCRPTPRVPRGESVRDPSERRTRGTRRADPHRSPRTPHGPPSLRATYSNRTEPQPGTRARCAIPCNFPAFPDAAAPRLAGSPRANVNMSKLSVKVYSPSATGPSDDFFPKVFRAKLNCGLK